MGSNQKEKRKRVYERDGGICYLCKKPVEFESSTLDHIVPRCRNGSNGEDNLKIAHELCNNQKADKLLHEFEKERNHEIDRFLVKHFRFFPRKTKRSFEKTGRCVYCLGSGIRKEGSICRKCNGWGIIKE